MSTSKGTKTTKTAAKKAAKPASKKTTPAKPKEQPIDPKKVEKLRGELQNKIDEIKNCYSKIGEGKHNQNSSAAEIGRLLMAIENDKLYKYDVDKDNKPIRGMNGFITNNFDFSSNYGIMLKQAAKIEVILDPEHKQDLSFGLLYKLSCYREKPDAVRAIWKNAKGTKNSPTAVELRKAIEKRKKDNPDELKKRGKGRKSWSDFLKSDEATLKAIGYRFVKLEEADRKAMDEGVKKELVAKIKELLG